MIEVLSRAWWLVTLRGLFGIALGVLAFAWPAITLFALILLFGAYLFVDGIAALIQAVRFRHERERWPLLLLEGVLGIIVGAIMLLFPGIGALAWLYTIAAWAFVTGIFEIASAVALRRSISGEWLLALTGVLSILLAVALVAMPLAGLLAWVYLIGAYGIFFGILLIGLGFRLRRLQAPASPSGLSRSGSF